MSEPTTQAAGTPSRALDQALQIAVIVGASFFVAFCARISLPIPGTPVPLTLQNFGVLVVGLALLLGWMLGRPSWENVPLRELRVRGQEKASPAVQRRRAATQPHKPVEKSVEKSTEQAANGSIAKRSVPAKSTAGGDPAPGALVIYQNGKEIFRMQPVAAEPRR